MAPSMQQDLTHRLSPETHSGQTTEPIEPKGCPPWCTAHRPATDSGPEMHGSTVTVDDIEFSVAQYLDEGEPMIEPVHRPHELSLTEARAYAMAMLTASAIVERPVAGAREGCPIWCTDHRESTNDWEAEHLARCTGGSVDADPWRVDIFQIDSPGDVAEVFVESSGSPLSAAQARSLALALVQAAAAL